MSTWAWAHIFGRSEAATRGFSVLCGALAAAVFANLVRRRLAPAEAIVATSVFLLAPLLQYYLAEARGYTLTLLLTAICIEAFEQLWEQPDRRSAYIIYGAITGALFLTSYFGAVMIGAHWLLWLARLRGPGRKRRIIGWMIAQAIIAACLAPWLTSLLYQLRAADVMTQHSPITPSTISTLAGTAMLGYPLVAPLTLAWGIPATIGWVLAAVGLRLPATPAAQGRLLSLRTLGLPLLSLAALVVVTHAIHPRYTITLLPGIAVAVAVGYSELRRSLPRLAFALLALLIAGMLLSRGLRQMQPVEQFWPELTAIVAEQARTEEDVVLFMPPWDQRVFEYYYAGPALPLIGAHHYDDFYYIQGHDIKTTWTQDGAVAVTGGYRRVWYFANSRHWEGQPLTLPYRQIGHWQKEWLELSLYEVPVP
ncbi:glycosyltransferase family 39 protein [Oscillochloris sp. ZM17-4]|uniref:glycosyltransferase family 39 protein n=1 Tax=Oscillochloris sp. ZM17-4 TaxID=2866714 RepID=UPI001C72EFB8|nr:glycosyltransferase family 39 protein [Oscillochloris sp. ZM17-4]